MVNLSLWTVAGNRLAVLSGAARLTDALRGELAMVVCDEESPLAADNAILIHPPESNAIDPRVVVLEPTGAVASFCGNGIGCVVAHLARQMGHDRLAAAVRVSSEASGEVTCQAKAVRRQARLWDFSVSLGRERSGIPDFIRTHTNVDKAVLRLNETRVVEGAELRAYFTTIGEPNIVLLAPEARCWKDLPDPPTELLTMTVTPSEVFPRRTNLMVASLPVGGQVAYRSFERNGRETLSCGSGVAAILAVLCNLGEWKRSEPLLFIGRGGECSTGDCRRHTARYHNGDIQIESSARLLTTGTVGRGAGWWDVSTDEL